MLVDADKPSKKLMDVIHFHHLILSCFTVTINPIIQRVMEHMVGRMTKHEGCIFDAQPRSQDPGGGDDSMAGGFLMSRVTKVLKLPNVTGYILAGVAIGPYALDLIPSDIVSGMEFITDIALAFIAFGVGRYLRLDRLKQQGSKVIVLTLMEALVTAAVVTAFMLMVFHLSLAFSLLLVRHRLRHRACFQPDDHPPVPRQGPFVNTPGAGGGHG